MGRLPGAPSSSSASLAPRLLKVLARGADWPALWVMTSRPPDPSEGAVTSPGLKPRPGGRLPSAPGSGLISGVGAERPGDVISRMLLRLL